MRSNAQRFIPHAYENVRNPLSNFDWFNWQFQLDSFPGDTAYSFDLLDGIKKICMAWKYFNRNIKKVVIAGKQDYANAQERKFTKSKVHFVFPFDTFLYPTINYNTGKNVQFCTHFDEQICGFAYEGWG